MSDAKLQKVTLGPDWIDLSFGEPKVIANACFKQLNHVDSKFRMPSIQNLPHYEYQPAAGHPNFISLLEEKYKAKVVITNGAKQGLDAIFHALKKNGHTSIHYEVPYYPASPGLIASSGLTRDEHFNEAQAMLICSPNNPDGSNYTNMFMKVMTNDRYVIHDAAYYTPIYLPDHQVVESLGHVQIFSMSKMYGLSGLRIGYVVFHDDLLYKDVVDFIETSTAGVSIASQDIAYSVEEHFLDNPNSLKEFEQESRDAISRNRWLLSQIDPEVMTVQECMSNSMFAWAQKGPKLNYMNQKVYMLDGSLFGDPTMVRMNIAVPYETLKEAIDRLNKI